MILEEVFATLEKARAALVASPYVKRQVSKSELVRLLGDYSPKAAQVLLSHLVESVRSFGESLVISPPRELVLAPTFGNLSPPLRGQLSPGAPRGTT